MWFNRENRGENPRIDAMTRELTTEQGMPFDLKGLLPFAEDIATELQRLDPDADGYAKAVEEAADTVKGKKVEELATGLLRATLQEMSPKERIAFYAQWVGGSFVEMAAKEAEREERWLGISREADVSGRFDLRNVAQGEQVLFGINRRESSHMLTVRRRDDGESQPTFQVVKNEIIRRSNIYDPVFQSHDLMRIGTPIYERGKAPALDPVVTYDTSAQFEYLGNLDRVDPVFNIDYVLLTADETVKVLGP